MENHIIIFCGNYGSGKTEISLNTALKLRQQGKKVTLVDLDIVNPYFRSSEQKEMLEKAGVKVLMPTFAGTTVDIPALPAEIQSIFVDKESTIILDVGGDDTGATALGRYFSFLLKEDIVLYMVINVRRPFSSDALALWTLQQAIEAKCRLKVNFYINNSNLALETTKEDLLAGQEIIKELSKISGVTQKYISGMPSILAQLPEKYKDMLYPIELNMRPDWMDV